MDIFSDKRKLAIIGLTVFLVALLAFIGWWLLRPKQQATTDNNHSGSTVLPVTSIEPALIEPATSAQIKEADSYPLGLRQLAVAFAERYGSYSSDEPKKSVEDLVPYMTARLYQELSSGSAKDAKSSVFTGFTTKALSTSLINLSASSVEISVKTQRTQTIDRMNKTFYADLLLKAQKIGDEWMIDYAAWQ